MLGGVQGNLESSKRDYMLMIASGTATMFSGGLIFPIFAPFVRGEFAAPLLLVGLAVSGYFLFRTFTELPIGMISDRMGPRTPLMLGRLLALIGASVCYMTNDIWQLFFARAIWGAGDASFFCIGMSYIASLYPANRRGRALGFFQAVENIGSFLGQSVGGFIAASFGIRSNFLAAIVLGSLSLGLVIMIKGKRVEQGKSNEGNQLHSTKEHFLGLINRTVITVCSINFLGTALNNGLTSTVLPIYVTEIMKMTLPQYGILMAVSTVGSVCGNLFGGLASDRIGRKRILMLGLAVGTVSTFSMTLSSSFQHFLPVLFFQGLFWGTLYGTTPVYIADSVPANLRGMGIGLFRTFMDAGGLVGPIVMSSIVQFVDGTQGYIFSFYSGAVMLILGLSLASMLKRMTTTQNADGKVEIRHIDRA